MLEPPPELVRAAAAGDEAAFTELVRLAQPHLWRFLVHLVGDPDVAADLTQDTLVTAHRALSGFRGECLLSTWLLRIARNAATDHHRRHLRQARLAAQAAALAPRHTPDAATAAEVRAAVAALPLRLREVFVLVEVVGLRYREAAVVLGVPDGTVKSRMYAARRDLVRWFHEGEGTAAGREVLDG